MIRELVQDALRIKMAAEKESPLISAYEFCYAAGLGCRVMGVPQEKAQTLRDMDSFEEMKKQMQEMTRENREIFGGVLHGERLCSLLLGCRFHGQADADARALFQTGYEQSLPKAEDEIS